MSYAAGLQKCGYYSENHGSVTARNTGTAGGCSAQALVKCYAAYNYGSVSSVSDSQDAATAFGVNGGTYNVNNAQVSVKAKVSVAHGTDNCDYSQNYGYVYAEATSEVASDHYASAYGIAGNQSYNKGNVYAYGVSCVAYANGVGGRGGINEGNVTAHSGHSNAYAYGASQDSVASKSTGVASATVDYYSIKENEVEWSVAYAEKSLYVKAYAAGQSIEASDGKECYLLYDPYEGKFMTNGTGGSASDLLFA